MKYQNDRHSMDIVFVLLVFASFMITATLLISLGTNEYRRIAASMQQNDNVRLPSAYVTQKVRQCRTEDAVHVTELDGSPALTLRQEIGGKNYITWLYTRKGTLRELLVPEGNSDFEPATGTPVLPIQDLSFEELGPGVVLVSLTPEDGFKETFIVTTAPR
ncbi:MAG: DUF4860 domain-containing protein [Clostridium sp.]|nr:DUF4860 domain-containing protein [Clostridium sp.]